MKPTTAAWLSTSAAIIACIIFTHRVAPLWFFLMPFFYSLLVLADGREEKPGMGAFENNE